MNSLRLLPLLLLLNSGVCSAQTYRWVDENGVVSYSQTPPPATTTERIKLPSASRSSPEAAQQRLQQLRQRLEDNREDRELATQKSQQLATKNARRRHNCQAARANLRNLQGLGKRLLHTSDGQYVRLTEEQRQQRMQEARKQIEANCPG